MGYVRRLLDLGARDVEFHEPGEPLRPQSLEPRLLSQASRRAELAMAVAFRQGIAIPGYGAASGGRSDRRLETGLGRHSANRSILHAEFFRRRSVRDEYFWRTAGPHRG